MDHWLKTIVHLLEAETSNLRELAEIAGSDPRTFYIGTNMDGTDLSGQDLRGMQFTSLDLRFIKTDSYTQLDDIYRDHRNVRPHNKWATETLGSVIPAEEWATSWLSRWHRAKEIASRAELAAEATNWLFEQPEISDAWIKVWERVWLSERRRSEGRNILFGLAMERVFIRENIRGPWPAIWVRLWKHSQNEPQQLLSAFLEDSIQWFTEHIPVSPEPYWIATWRAHWKASRELPHLSSKLVSFGNDFLDRFPEHSVWSSIWRDLWEDGKNRNFLTSKATIWLADTAHAGWGPVWRRTWKSSSLHVEDRSKVASYAFEWIDNNFNDSTWPLIWLSINNLPINQHKISLALRTSNSWLSRLEIKNDHWLHVWLKSLELCTKIRTNPSVLLDFARVWLNSRFESDIWLDVWRQVWAAESRAEARIYLQRLVLDWRNHHSISEHALNLRLDAPPYLPIPATQRRARRQPF